MSGCCILCRWLVFNPSSLLPPLGPSEVQLRDVVLLLPCQRPDCLFRAPPADHCARLLLRGEAEAQLSGAAGLLQDQLHLQVAQQQLSTFNIAVVSVLHSACSIYLSLDLGGVCSYANSPKDPGASLEVQVTLDSLCPVHVCFRSRLADFFVNCQPEPRSLSGCLKENYADCLLAYSGLIGG